MTSLKYILFLISAIILQKYCYSQKTNTVRDSIKTIKDIHIIQWYNIEEAQELQKKQPKKILIDMFTQWCGWCKKMDASTFSNPNIAAYINQFFYAVKFDAETFDTIKFKEKIYINEQAGKIDPKMTIRKPPHKLAVELLNGKMSYPTIVFLDEELNNLGPVPGYKTPQQIEPMLMYFAENVYKNVAWNEFERDFNKCFWDTVHPDTTLVKWYSLQEAIDMNLQAPKKIFIDLYVNWGTLCKIMFKTTYNQPLIAKYLNDNYYPVRFNATSKDTIYIQNQPLINEGKGHPFHQFAVTALQGKMKFPVIIFMDEQNKFLTVIPDFRTAENLEPVLRFFKEDIYKTTKYEEFIKTFVSQIKKTN